MRTKLLLVSIMFAALQLNNASAQKNISDITAIKKVLDQETRSFFQLKYDAWADNWLQDSTVFRTSASPSGYSTITGWNNMSADTKNFMQNSTVYTEQQMAPYLNKFDYKFNINGNAATVFFKEGATPATASDESRLMIKQNGQWKIAGITIFETPAYNFLADQQKLKKFIGRWSINKGSFKTMPADTALSLVSFSIDTHETMNGIESTSTAITKYAGNVNASQEVEQFIADNNSNKFWYFDNQKSADGSAGAGVGTAAFDSSGNFVVTIMYDDKPVARQKNIFMFNAEGSLHLVAEFYSKDGEKTNSWSCDLVRM